MTRPATELHHQGRCPTCGHPRITAATCTCGHLVTAHAFGTGRKAGVRTSCTSHGCQCKTYQEVT